MLTAVGFEDAIEAERRNCELQQRLRAEEEEKWTSAAVSARAVLDEFLALMAGAGNPGLRTFKQRRGRDDMSFLALLPAKRIRGWQVGLGIVITPEGRVFARLLDSNEVVGGPGLTIETAFTHSTSGDGKPYGPYAADEIKAALAPVLVDAGIVVGGPRGAPPR